MADVKKTRCTPISIPSRVDSLHPITIILLLIIISGAFFACAQKQMTLDEAKQTTISFRGKSFVPPPRSIDDILAILDKENSTYLSAGKELYDKSQMPPPINGSKSDLTRFYFDRGNSHMVFRNYQQSRHDFQEAFDLATSEGGQHRGLLTVIAGNLAAVEIELGNYQRGLSLLNTYGEGNMTSYYNRIKVYAALGNFTEVERARKEGVAQFESIRQKDTFTRIQRARLEYVFLGLHGKHKEAEIFHNEAVFESLKIQQERPDVVFLEKRKLSINLVNQKRYIEAEFEIRQIIKESVRLSGPESMHFVTDMQTLAEVLLAQGRIKEANKIINSAIQTAEKLGIAHDSAYYSMARLTLGKILAASGDYLGAANQLETFSEKIKTNIYIYNIYYSQNVDLMFSYAMANKGNEIASLIDAAYNNNVAFLGKNHAKSAELLAIRGIANAKLGNFELAWDDFTKSIPNIAQHTVESGGLIPAYRFKGILESYIALLGKIAGNHLERKLGVNASAKAFEISSLLENQNVQKAVLDSSTRMAVDDEKLLEVIRTEQDVQLQINAYQNVIQGLLTQPIDDRDIRAINDVKAIIEKLNSAREVITKEIVRRFPTYANLVNPREPSLAEVQRLLRPDEVLVSICSTENSTFVWAVSQQGQPAMAMVPLTQKELEKRVFDLRSSLIPLSDRLGQLPEFNFQKAHELYSLLLKPIEPAWKEANHLIIVTTGPASQIPFSTLPIRPFHLEKDSHELFSSYRKAPWLVRTHTITTVPSVSSFVGLRSLPIKARARETFAGFGDPFFNKKQLSEALSEKKSLTAAQLGKYSKMNVRGIRLTENGTLDSDTIMSCSIESLKRLSDTADEIQSIAEALGADPSRDVYLGLRASEKQVKMMDLSDRRVIAFASHALVPYDLDGLDQPAIALSAPSVTGDDDDGLLTMGEILELKLNADWVVLSACNTGAAQGAGAETISGLGRAFFYAGTKAILASMWPVETTSAKKLTTTIFRHQKEKPTMSRATAHQQSMLELIDDPGIVDENGSIVASYAHPFFWAPFIIVGDNGMTTTLN